MVITEEQAATVPDMAPRPIREAELVPAIVLREIYRHYLSFRDYVGNGGSHILEHSYLVEDSEGDLLVWAKRDWIKPPPPPCWISARKVTIRFSFWDLHRGLKDLAPRKKEAFFYNVILDQKQRTVARYMDITTVSVGQYVKHAVQELITQHILPIGVTDGS